MISTEQMNRDRIEGLACPRCDSPIKEYMPFTYRCQGLECRAEITQHYGMLEINTITPERIKAHYEMFPPQPSVMSRVLTQLERLEPA